MSAIDINILPSLIKEKEAVYLDEIPSAFQQDVISFIAGETIRGRENGRIRIPEKLYKKWLKKIWLKGFDYDISLKNDERH